MYSEVDKFHISGMNLIIKLIILIKIILIKIKLIN